ncbi:NUDIX hydrolase [Candidatus Nomurabacteria bacterium]|nr:NUDIX hydrolase [Candidatus Nomurabacteria bacterium]
MSKSKLRVAGCFLEHKGKFLILYRPKGVIDADTWGLPAGKVEQGESDEESMVREIFEETGVQVDMQALRFLEDYHFDFPDLYLEFLTFRVILEESVNIVCNPREHAAFKWVTPEECYAMSNLIRGFHDLLERVGYIQKKI